MSSQRHADAELQATLKAELKNTTAERVLMLMAAAMRELGEEGTDLKWFWFDGEIVMRKAARDTENWG